MLARGILTVLPMLGFLSTAACAEVLQASRTLRAQTLIQPEDVMLVAGDRTGAALSAEDVIGRETRVTIYAGRPIRPDDIGPAAAVERNQVVPLIYRNGPLVITDEGRALTRAGVGETIRAMNITSRVIVSASVGADGTLTVFTKD